MITSSAVIYDTQPVNNCLICSLNTSSFQLLSCYYIIGSTNNSIDEQLLAYMYLLKECFDILLINEKLTIRGRNRDVRIVLNFERRSILSSITNNINGHINV